LGKRARGSVDAMSANAHAISEFIGTLQPEATDNANVASVFQMKVDDIQKFLDELTVEELKMLGEVKSINDQGIRTVFSVHKITKVLDVLFA